MPNFKNDEERMQWIVANNEYFTIIRRRNLTNERVECKTLAEAEAEALRMLTKDKTARLMIYAVTGPYSAYIKTIKAKQSG